MMFMGLFLTLPVGERFRVKDIMQRVMQTKKSPTC